LIGWIRKESFKPSILKAGNAESKDLIPTFNGIYFHHIFREANGEADQLSKQALSATKGRITYFTWDGEIVGPTLHVDIF
jgi:hypothetical protein